MATNHVYKRLDFGEGRFKPTCSCRQSGDTGSRQEADDWYRVHKINVERIKSYLRKSNPSMEDQADYFRAQSLEDRDQANHPIWKQLADELDTRLGRNAPPSKQEQLF